MIKLVLFDFDGVIFDSVSSKTEAFKDVYRDSATGAQLKHIEEYHLAHGGVNRIHKFKYYEEVVFGRDCNQEKISDLCKKFEYFYKNRSREAKIITGSRDFLTLLESLSIRRMIVSGAPREEIHSILESNDLRHFFEEVYDGIQDKVHHINNILKKNGLKKEDVVFLGDSMTDYEAAMSCSIPFIAVNPSFPAMADEMARVPSVKDLFLKQGTGIAKIFF